MSFPCVCLSHRLVFFLASPSEEEEAGGKNDLRGLVPPLADLSHTHIHTTAHEDVADLESLVCLWVGVVVYLLALALPLSSLGGPSSSLSSLSPVMPLPAS